MSSIFQGHTDELWGLATHPFKDLLLTCAQDRQVCMWHSVEHRLEWTRLLDVSEVDVVNLCTCTLCTLAEAADETKYWFKAGVRGNSQGMT